MKAVFDTKPNSGYDDAFDQYHFPTRSNYMAVALAARVVQNGIALSGTIHWLFDRHLISLTDDDRLLVSHNKVPSELRGLFANQMERIHLPEDHRLRPHPAYLARHRQAFVET